MNKLIKPYGVSVEIAFRRIDVMTNLLDYFPPTSSRGKSASAEQWEAFKTIKKEITSAVKREMKYNLLPESFHDRFDELETDWSEMTNSKFLSEAQKCEAADTKDRDKQKRSREQAKRKKSEESDSVSNLSRSQQNKNKVSKKAKKDHGTNPQGQARLCELCKAAGAPEFVFRTHNANQCKKKNDYAKALSGGAAERKSKTKEYRSHEKSLQRELKLLKQIKKLQVKNKKGKKDDDSSSDSSQDDDNISF